MKHFRKHSKYLIVAAASILTISGALAQVTIPTGLTNAVQYLRQSVRTNNGTASGTVNVNIHTGGIYIRTGFLLDGTWWNNRALWVDNSGNVVYVNANAINNPLLFPTANYIPKVNPTQDGLDISTMYQTGWLIWVNTINPVKSIDILGDFQVTTAGSSLTYQYQFLQNSSTSNLLSILQTQQCSCDTTLTALECNAPFSATAQDLLYCVDITSQDPNNSNQYFYTVFEKIWIGTPEPVLVTMWNSVWVRTSNPQAALHVSGNVMIWLNNTITDTYGMIGGGRNHIQWGIESSIAWGSWNRIWSIWWQSFIWWWIQNRIDWQAGFIWWWTNNILFSYLYSNGSQASTNNSIVGWSNNRIHSDVLSSAVIGGDRNTMRNSPSGTVGRRSIILWWQNNTLSWAVDSLLWWSWSTIFNSRSTTVFWNNIQVNNVNTPNTLAWAWGVTVALWRNIQVNWLSHTFVYNNTTTTVSPTAPGQFLIYAGRWVGINTTPAQTFDLTTNNILGISLVQQSDERLKTNIMPYTTWLNAIIQLEPKTFDYNGLGGTSTATWIIGLIADEVINILPEIVRSYPWEINGDPTNIYGLNLLGLHFITINAIKELYNMLLWNISWIGGEVNDGINIWWAVPIFAGKNWLNLQFKTLTAGNNITLTSTANTIGISAIGDINNGTNVWWWQPIYHNKAGNILQFKTLQAGPNINIAETAWLITISAVWWVAGEINDGQNIGVWSQVFAQKVWADLQFRTLIGQWLTTIIETPNTININTSPQNLTRDPVNQILGITNWNTISLATPTTNTSRDIQGNGGTNPSSNFIGTIDNQALVLRTNNIQIGRLFTNGSVMRWRNNTIATAHNATIAWWTENSISSPWNNGTIAWWTENTISDGTWWFIGGGKQNTARWNYSAIAWWENNQAMGHHSFAAWLWAQAVQANTFVRSNGPSFASTAANQFLIGPNAHVGINTNINPSTIWLAISWSITFVANENNTNRSISMAQKTTGNGNRLTILWQETTATNTIWWDVFIMWWNAPGLNWTWWTIHIWWWNWVVAWNVILWIWISPFTVWNVWVRTTNPENALHILGTTYTQGAVRRNIEYIDCLTVPAGWTYNVTNNDHIIVRQCANSTTTIALPTAEKWREIIIRKRSSWTINISWLLIEGSTSQPQITLNAASSEGITLVYSDAPLLGWVIVDRH
jgi:hypothetical protein